MGRIRRVWESYWGIWEKLTGWRLFFFYLLHYTALFAVLQCGVFSAFDTAGKSFIWRADGLPNYFSGGLVYISQTIRDGIQKLLAGDGWSFPLYDFRRGVIKTAFEQEPINLLAVFWPWDRIDILYDALVLMRYYLAGVSFSVLGFYFKQRPLPIAIGAVTYTFCGFSIYAGVRHPFFMAGMIYLPLLVIGAEKMLRGERAWLFTGIVFFSLISSLYFSCMLAILILIYILVRYCCDYWKDGVRGFGRLVGHTALWGGLGVLLSGISWAPTLLQMTGTGRIGRDVVVLFKYASSYYQHCLTRFIVVPGDVGGWTCLGFSVLAVPAVLLLFLDKRKTVKGLKVLFLVLTGMVCMPIAGYVMSGFNTYSNRWMFTYALCVAIILTVELPQLLTAERKLLAVAGGGTVAYVAICCLLVRNDYYCREPLVLLFFSLVMIIFCYVAGKEGKVKILPLCLAITCLSVNYSAFMMYDPKGNNYVSEFTDKGTAYTTLESGQYASLGRSEQIREDGSLFYVLGNAITRPEINSSYYSGVNGLSYFSSCAYDSYRMLKANLEVGQQYLNNVDFGLDGQATLLSLANVKYYALRETGIEIKPFGMEEIDRIQNGNRVDVILENPYALSVGYTYDSWQSEDEFMALPTAGRQAAMLQAVVLKEMPEQDFLLHRSVDVSCQNVPVEIVAMDGVSWKDGSLKVTNENATMTLSFSSIPNNETYLRVVNLDLTSGDSGRRWDLAVDTGITRTASRFTADGYVYASGAKTQLIYLGNTPEGFNTCILTFPKKGTFILDGLEIWCQPMDHYAEQIEALRAEALENVTTNWRGLTGTISTTKDKFLCFSIPYDEGWTVYVDGEKANLVPANIGFMGVELPAGDHNIELKYWPSGLTIGILISCIGAAVGVVVLAFRKREKGR